MSVKFSDLIRVYNGEGDFSEWLDKLEFVAKLQKIEDLVSFVPLFLEKGAFAVFKSLSENEKSDYVLLKQALTRAFSSDKFQAYDQFVTRILKQNESVDVYVADLQRLINLVDSSKSKEIIECAFVRGLPAELRQQMTAACSLNKMSLDQMVERARSLRKATPEQICMVARGEKLVDDRVICYKCKSSGHIMRDCPTNRQRNARPNVSSASSRYCYICGDVAHLANLCPKRVYAPVPKNVPKND